MALYEIYSTPEGQELINNASSKFGDQPIRILFWQNGYTVALKMGAFTFGSEDADAMYPHQSNSESIDVSIQRVLVHELSHLALNHTELRGDEDEYGVSSTEESEAVRYTNAFMEKYYKEPNRPEQTIRTKLGGTKVWDFNPRFQLPTTDQTEQSIELLRQKVLDGSVVLSDTKVPELQSLYENANSIDRFFSQYFELQRSGFLSDIDFNEFLNPNSSCYSIDSTQPADFAFPEFSHAPR